MCMTLRVVCAVCVLVKVIGNVMASQPATVTSVIA